MECCSLSGPSCQHQSGLCSLITPPVQASMMSSYLRSKVWLSFTIRYKEMYIRVFIFNADYSTTTRSQEIKSFSLYPHDLCMLASQGVSRSQQQLHKQLISTHYICSVFSNSAAGTMHDGAASPDRPETRSTRDY